MKLRVDMSQWTFGDQIDLEENGYTLRQMKQLLADGEVPTKLAVLLVWLFRRKEEPLFTFADARAITVIGESLDLEVVEDPADPKGARSGGSRVSAPGPAGRRKK